MPRKPAVPQSQRRKGWASQENCSSTRPAAPVTRPPDLSTGLCHSTGGRGIAELGMNLSTTQTGIDDRAQAKDLCYSCPARKACAEYVLANEMPRGSWGGVWGGLDSWNRKGRELIISDSGSRQIPFYIDEWKKVVL